MYRVRISDKVLVRVEGTTTDDFGNDVPFKLHVLNPRRDEDQISAFVAAKRPLDELMRELTSHWTTQDILIDDDGNAAPFSFEHLELLQKKLPYLSALWWSCYQRDNGVKAKQGN